MGLSRIPFILGVSPPATLSRMTISGKLTPNTSGFAAGWAATAWAISRSVASLRRARRNCGVMGPAAQQAIRRTSSSMGARMPSAVGLEAGSQSYSFTHSSRPSRDTAALMSVPPTSMPQHTPRSVRRTACRSRGRSVPPSGLVSGSGGRRRMSRTAKEKAPPPKPRHSRSAMLMTLP